MRLRVLGCSGGIGGLKLRTTSFLLDDDILIDAGTGVGELSLEELVRIDHVFVTHAHLDHVASIPFMVDTVGGMRSAPLVVHGIGPTLEALRKHIFNWEIWPDFSSIPSAESPYLRFSELECGSTVDFGGRRITALPARHTVPAVGYRLDSGAASLVFTGDTGPGEELWAAVNAISNLRYLIIETAFSNSESKLAAVSRHLCPDTLATELGKLRREAEVYVTHLKPGESELIMREVKACAARWKPHMLEMGHTFDF